MRLQSTIKNGNEPGFVTSRNQFYEYSMGTDRLLDLFTFEDRQQKGNEPYHWKEDRQW